MKKFLLFQGVYDVITNLGALVARIIFAPLEESAYVYFSLNIKRGTTVEHQTKVRFCSISHFKSRKFTN